MVKLGEFRAEFITSWVGKFCLTDKLLGEIEVVVNFNSRDLLEGPALLLSLFISCGASPILS